MNSQQETRKTSKTFRIFLTAALLAGLMLGLAPAGPVHAATITVNSTADVIADDGQCTLREAITAANTDTASGGTAGECPAGSGADIITLPAGTYLLTLAVHSEDTNASGDLDLTSSITINGAGAESTIIDAGQLDRVMHVTGSAVVELNDLTLTNGLTRYGSSWHYFGGGVYSSGELTIRDSIIRDNTTGSGTGSSTSGGRGGGVYSIGTLTIENSAIRGNTTGDGTNNAGDGGGVAINSGTATIRDSAISGNVTGNSSTNVTWDGRGGGMYFNGGTVTIQNTTISGNAARGSGGGLANYLAAAPAVTLAHCTITDNTSDTDNDASASGGGLWWRANGGFIVENTIIAGNTDVGNGATDDCNSTLYYTSQDYNLVGLGTGCPSGGTGDQTTSDPGLGPLQDNGGPTETHALWYDSPALDVIPDLTNGCGDTYTTDQRGATRPTNGACDVGAYESPYIFWDGGGADNNTSTAANWSGDTLPVETDIPVFYNTGKQATVDADLTVAGWVIDTSPSDDIYLGFSEPYPVLTVNGDWLQLSGYFNGGNSLIDIAGAFDLSGGQFVAPQSPGLLTVGGGFHHTGGTFNSYSGRVVLDNTSDQTLATAAAFHDLVLNDGLVGYWKLDEGSGATAADSSGYGHAGTLAGGPTWSTTKPDLDFYNPYDLRFARAAPADYVNIPNTTAIDDLQELTIAAWVRLDATPSDVSMRFVTLRNEKAVLRYKDVGGSGKLHFYMKIGGSLQSIEVAHTWGTSNWYHVTGTYDGSTMRLYLNGTEQPGAVSVSGTVIAGDGIHLSWSGSDEALDGLLDDVRIYSRALSGTEIQSLADGEHPETSLATTSLGAALDVNGDLTLNSGTLDVTPPQAGYWKLDDGGAATSAADSSSNGNHGTLNGGPIWTTTHAPTNFSNPYALDFDGTDDYVTINGVADDISEDVSIAFWVKAPSGGGAQALVAVNTANQDNVVILFIYGDEYWVHDGNSWEGDTNTIVADDTWHHLAYTSDGATGRLYVDGVQKATHTPNYTLSSDNLWSLAQEWDSGGASNFLTGILDDVRIYDLVLSASAIQTLADGDEFYYADINVAGDFVRNGGVFEPGGGTVTFDGSGDQNLDTDAIAFYDLTVSSSSTLVDLAEFTVDGMLTNNGSLRQTNDTPNGSTTQFLRILNAAGDAAKYYGVDITPSGDMGATSVTIRGNQDCTTDDTSQPVRRCFEISPMTSRTADVAFWYLDGERNGNTAGSVNVFHWESNAWVQETGTYTRNDDGTHYSVKVTGVDNYSPFILDDVSPTAVTLREFRARAASGVNVVVALAALITLVSGLALLLRARRRRPGRERPA